MHEHTNRLIHETSPYLLQHAHNPVDWYPWGEEALEKAQRENKPILLSIGYSACHWCHVMERESFEDPETARVMNEHFVNIKVDREERPDLDAVYMAAVQALTGQGGWPMTVFLTPEGEPFYGGTYFPPEDRHGLPGFRRVLLAVAEAYREQPDAVAESAQQVTARVRAVTSVEPSDGDLSPRILEEAFHRLQSAYDKAFGGFGGAPKFPSSGSLEFLLRVYLRLGFAPALQMVERTLERMARGGVYDQLGGGFHRYSVDQRWLVPHFEKMLYDNALLSRAYLHAYQVTGRSLYRRVVEETLDYVLREMTDGSTTPVLSEVEGLTTGPAGGFYSTQDADSEGVEGKFFVWTPQEITAALGQEDGELINRYFGLDDGPNFEGKNILHVPRDPDVVAHLMGVSDEELETRIARARRRLFEVREQRVKPGRDDKVLTAWNGLMLTSFAEAARVLGREDYLRAAVANAEFLLTALRRPDGRLLHSWKACPEGSRRNSRARFLGYQEDYAFLAAGLLALYETTFDPRWFIEARALVDEMIRLFSDEERGGFYQTGADHEVLVSRPKELFDEATPAGNSVAADVLLRLAAYTGEPAYARQAVDVFRLVQDFVARQPTGFGYLLCAMDFHLTTPQEVAIVGQPDADDTRALLEVMRGRYRPNTVVAVAAPDDAAAIAAIPLLADRPQVDGRATAYVCRQFACQAPVTEPEALAAQLNEQ